MLKLDLQLFAHKKGMGSTKNGRDSNQKDSVQKEQTVSSFSQATFSIAREEHISIRVIT